MGYGKGGYSDYDVVYPPKGRVTLDGGLNNKFIRTEIEDNESPDCQNVLFGDGAATTIDGFAKFNTTAVGSFVCDGLYTRRDNTGVETMVGFWNGTMYANNVSTFSTIASAQSVFTAGVRVATCQYQNYMFIGNGGVSPYKYNGADFTRHGVPAAIGAPTTASQTTGGLTGDYRYKVTYVNSAAVEGDVGTSTVTLTAAAALIRLTSIPTAPVSHGVVARRIYRTEAGGIVFKRLTEIADNTTTQYDDNTADSGLGVNAPTDNGEPPNYSTCIYHMDRLFVNDPTNPGFVYYSNVAEPFTFESTNFLRVGDQVSDLVKGFEVHENGILVLCERSPYLIYMPSADDTTWRVLKINSPYGGKSRFGMFRYNNKVMYPAVQNDKFLGFAAVVGGTLDKDATQLEVGRVGSDLKSTKIEPDMFAVQEAYLDNISAMVYKNKAYLSVTYGSGATTNNRVYIFDFSDQNLSDAKDYAWVPVTSISAAQFAIYAGNLYFGSSAAEGRVYKMHTGSYNNDGAAIDSYIWTKEFSGNNGHENLQKDFRYVNLFVEKSGAYYMTLSYRIDSDNSSGQTQNVYLGNNSTTWGGSTWGGGFWSSGQAQDEIKIYLGQVTGKRIQFRFSNQNTVGQKFAVHGLNFGYNVKGKR